MKHKWLCIPIFAVLVLIDQLTKRLAMDVLAGGEPLVLIRGILELTYVENRGAAFGILQNRQWIFLVITVVILAVILYLMVRMPRGRRFLPLCFCLTALSAGAVGNMIDRATRAFVVDFIYFKPIDFPVFNVADIYVTVSAALLACLFLFYYREDETEEIFGTPKR